MEQVPCGHCHGSGQEWQSVDLNTGQVQYRTCSVCGGSGSVSVDRAYFSQYPDVSLRNALDLMQRHGQPVEICITDDDVRVLFGNGSRYVLGGFTVGYRGTGPDFAKRFLDAAGFDVSMDDIAGMKPPVTLTAGQSYVPQSPVAPAPTAAGEPRLEEAESGKAPPLISEAEPSPALASSRRGQVAGCLAGLLAVALVCLCGACCLGIGAMWLVRDSALQTTGRPASPKPATRTPGAVPTRMPGPPPPASPVPVMPTPGAVPTYRPELAPPVIPPFLQDKLPILQETFGTNARGWHQQGPTQVQVKNGQLCLTMGINDQHDIVWCADGCGPYPGSYYYQADLTLESVGDIECYYGLVFDLTDNDYYSFQILKDNNYHLAKSAGNEWLILIDSRPSPAIRQAGVNTLGVHVHAGQIDLYINGVMVDTYQDPRPLGPGQIGFFIKNIGEVLVDNVLVYADESTGKVNINTTTVAELETLPGIGPAVAQRIVEYRQTRGRFTRIKDLKQVSGIGDQLFEQIKDLITV